MSDRHHQQIEEVWDQASKDTGEPANDTTSIVAHHVRGFIGIVVLLRRLLRGPNLVPDYWRETIAKVAKALYEDATGKQLNGGEQ